MGICQECDSNNVILTRRVIRNGSIQYVNQCRNCGRTIGNAIQKERALRICSVPQDFDPEIQVRYRKQSAESWAESRKQQRTEFFEWCDVYLNSDEWHKKRELVLIRSKGHCEGCGTARATEVHHLTYKHVGNELLFELVALCHQCHETAHSGDEDNGQN